ncbi:MAG: hypothetical protein ACM3ZB_05625 [bacterium]
MIEASDRRIVYFSVDRFVSEIAQGAACFICGCSVSEKQFSGEHVLPDWLLKRHGLHSGRVVLPNSAEFMYGRYVVPCCSPCNARMAEVFEVPISTAFGQGYDAVGRFIRDGGGSLLFIWLASLFLKTHLKHRELRWHLDSRLGDEKIADLYDWKELHHIHCIVRSFYSGARLTPRVYGSLALLPANMDEGPEHFDYGDLFPGRAVLLRSGDTALVAVLNDSGAVLGAMKEVFDKIRGPLTRLQLRELMVRMAYCNMLLEPRPRYYSDINAGTEEYIIDAEVPETFTLVQDSDPALLGQLFYHAVGPILEALPERVDPSVLNHVRKGRFTFLFDDNGDFLASSS